MAAIEREFRHARQADTPITSPAGAAIAYERYGSGPPLVLVHGSFSDQKSNWELVAPLLAKQFTVYAVARRGRGGTDATGNHSVEDEGRDIAAVIEAIGKPIFLLGHSYGAHIALSAATEAESRIRKLILYEPPWPDTLGKEAIARLEKLAQAGEWDGFAATFFQDVLFVPSAELNEMRAMEEIWPPIVADAEATLGDLRAMSRYDLEADRFRELRMPVMLQIGTESPRELFVTDALAAVLPDARIEALPDQAHEAMTTVPEQYAASVSRFLLS